MDKKNIKLETIMYFLTHYFSQSFGWSELSEVTYEFREENKIDKVNQLLEELYALQTLNDWEYVGPLLKTEDRSFRPHLAKELVKIMIACLTDETWNPSTYER